MSKRLTNIITAVIVLTVIIVMALVLYKKSEGTQVKEVKVNDTIYTIENDTKGEVSLKNQFQYRTAESFIRKDVDTELVSKGTLSKEDFKEEYLKLDDEFSCIDIEIDLEHKGIDYCMNLYNKIVYNDSADTVYTKEELDKQYNLLKNHINKKIELIENVDYKEDKEVAKALTILKQENKNRLDYVEELYALTGKGKGYEELEEVLLELGHKYNVIKVFGTETRALNYINNR